MNRSPLLRLYKIISALGLLVILAGSLTAVFTHGGKFIGYWGSVLGPLAVVVSAFGLGTIAWAILSERNAAVKEFDERSRK